MTDMTYFLGTHVRVETVQGAKGMNPNRDTDYSKTLGDLSLLDSPKQRSERIARFTNAVGGVITLLNVSNDMY